MAILVSERLDIRLTALYPDFSRSRLQGLIDAGFVKVNGEVSTKASAKVDEDAAIEVFFPPPVPAEPQPEDIPLDIIFEDDDIIVINKPAGLVVHPAPGHNTGTLVNAVLHHCPILKGIGGVARPGIVHRLDQDTSGVMVIAKSQPAMLALARDFASRSNMRKVYVAIVHGRPVPAEGRIENMLGRHRSNRKKMAIVQDGRSARTHWQVLERLRGATLIECRLTTGRTHQIRVHMASIGHPVLGDPVYGPKKSPYPVDGGQLLHAYRIGFVHPRTGEELIFEADPEPRFTYWLEKLRMQ